MNLQGILQFFHLVFAFAFVGSLVVAEWNSRAARATEDWTQRAALFHIIYLSSRVAGVGSLFLSGLLGHAAATVAGFRMAHDRWLWIVTVVWLAALLLMFLVSVPKAAELSSIARSAAGGGSSDGWPSALARWRFANVMLSVLYLTLLALMVFSWRS